MLNLSRVSLLFLSLILISGHAHAEYLGLPNGRSANPGMYPDITVEVGFVSGDLGRQDYQNIAARVNYRLSNEMVLFGNFGVNTAELDVSVIVLEALISSPTPLVDNGLSWYGNLGIHRLGENPGNNDFEFGFGGGVYLPVGVGEAYFGADIVDEITFGVGYRYFLQ